jgi:Mg/Co/Ni transporter MgtE
MESVDYDRIKRNETIQCIAPSIRHILCKILDTENQINIFKREPNTQIEVMGMFNVNEIIDGLDTLYSELLPISEQYLPNIDNQAELTALFCSNYIHTLIKKVKNNAQR